MAVQTTINTTSGTFLNKQFYDKKLLETARTKLVHATFGQKRPIPRNQGKTVEFRRWDLFDASAAMTPLTEGVTPDSQSLSQSNTTATVAQYGAYVEVSDLLELTAYDQLLADSAQLLGEQIGTVIEWVTRDAMNEGSNVQYAGAKTARNAVTTTDILTVNEIRKAVRSLKKAKARRFTTSADGSVRRPHFVCICSPEATYDLQSDPLWQDVSKYNNAEQIYSGEIGRLFGVVFVESTETKVFAGEGSGSIDVHSTLVFGADAYGIIDVGGQGAMQIIVKPHGSAGTSDPLNQRATVGAKVGAYAAKILNPLWIVRIEHAVSA